MSKVKVSSFVRLDFITVKPYLTVKTLLIYAVMAVFLTTMSENLATGMGVGMMLGTLFMSYPFALGEKGNLDALYATLSLRRNTVVLGRYIFALFMNISAIILSVVLGAAGTFALNAYRGTDTAVIAAGAAEIAIALFALFLLIQSIQLPVYFKFGYTKAKFLSVIPFVAIMVGYMSILRLPDVEGAPEFLENMFASGMIIPLTGAALVIIVFISYRLSRAFYSKREF